MTSLPTHDQLCTLCEQTKANLDGLLKHLNFLLTEVESTKKSIIAAQGVLAAFQVATGEPYDTATVPMRLVIDLD